MDHLYGTAGAPLAATRRYWFRREVGEGYAAKLTIPVRYRATWDDYGVVEYDEQDRFVDLLLKREAVEARTGYPGEWIFPDTRALDRAWAALTHALREPATAPPVGQSERDLSAAEAGVASAALTPAFLALASTLAGVNLGAFECIDRGTDTSGPTMARTEGWRRGEIYARLEATAIESGYGVHGETCAISLAAPLSDGRNVRVYARIDARSGGRVEVTVEGALDAQALADAFVGGLLASPP